MIWTHNPTVPQAPAAKAETEASRATRLAWASWLTEGPAKGLRRQHRMSRTSMGWTPTRVAAPEELRLSEADLLDELDETQLKSLLQPPQGEPLPLDAQQVADKEAAVWAACGQKRRDALVVAVLGSPEQ